jgi:hypothetical protein
VVRRGGPKPLLRDRCDVSEEIIDETYDERGTSEKRELRQKMLDELKDDSSGGGYL